MSSTSILDEIEQSDEQRRQEMWAAYREIIQRNGSWEPADKPRLKEAMHYLGISSADAKDDSVAVKAIADKQRWYDEDAEREASEAEALAERLTKEHEQAQRDFKDAEERCRRLNGDAGMARMRAQNLSQQVSGTKWDIEK